MGVQLQWHSISSGESHPKQPRPALSLYVSRHKSLGWTLKCKYAPWEQSSPLSPINRQRLLLKSRASATPLAFSSIVPRRQLQRRVCASLCLFGFFSAVCAALLKLSDRSGGWFCHWKMRSDVDSSSQKKEPKLTGLLVSILHYLNISSSVFVSAVKNHPSASAGL